MSQSNRASETAELNLKLSVNDTQSFVRCALKDHETLIKSEKVIDMSLRHLIDKEEITTTVKQSSTYNKRTFPFEMSDDKHVRALNIITAMFCNPWEFSKVKRKDLTDDIADFFIAISEQKIVLLKDVDYKALVANQKKSKKKTK